MRAPSSLGWLLLLVATLVTAAALVGLPARATYGARTTADEPQYLLSALSLAEDADLDISDELADRRYRPFHAIELDQQTFDLDADGQRLSPHDPLLPAILAAPMAVGGWPAAKATLAVLAGTLAALTTWIAVRRLHVEPITAAVVVGAFAMAPPLVSYGSQVYPEVPAALAVTVAVAALTGSMSSRALLAAGAAIVTLPWLSVKYAAVAAVLAALLVRRSWAVDRARTVATVGTLAVLGLVYLAVHQRVYGGWTVYAAGDHFVDGELEVVGRDPDYLARSRRLIGLLVDRQFGLAAWNPAWLIAVPAVGWATAARLPHRWVLVAPLATGWAVATWVALTMHGWWWPGRQVVVVLPLAVLLVAAAADRRVAYRAAAVVGACLGLAGWIWLSIESHRGHRTLVVDFFETGYPPYRLWAHLLPDHQRMAGFDWALTALWLALVGWLLWWGWRSGRRDQDAGRREGADTDVVALDLDRGGAVG